MNVYEIRRVKDGIRVSYTCYSNINKSIRHAIEISLKNKKDINLIQLKTAIKHCGIAFIFSSKKIVIEIKKHKVVTGG